MGRRKGDKARANGANGRRRANNTGTLEKRGDKWLARWYVYTPQGKRLRKSQMITAENIDEARAQLRDLTEGNALMSAEKDIKRDMERLQGVRAEIQRFEDSRPALALADMFAAYEDSPDRPQKSGRDTMRMYEMQIGRFVAWMAAHYPEATEMRQVSKEIATAFLSDFGKTISPNTYNKYATLLRAVWRTLGEKARCPGNPWEGVRRKTQSEENGRRALTIDELTRVCSTLTGEMRVLFALGLYTGLRLGDCCLMDWGTVDMVRRVIVTTPRKTKKKKTIVEIPLHSALYAILDETPPRSRTGYLMPDMAATYERGTSAVAARIRRAFETAGFKTRAEVDGYANAVAKVGFHSLRHTFVSLMGNAGAPLALVQSIVGHSNPMMTAHYFHARTDALANAVGNLPAITGETIDADAATSPAERTDAPPDAEPQTDAETRLRAFKAAYMALTDADREAAAAWIAERRSMERDRRRATA